MNQAIRTMHEKCAASKCMQMSSLNQIGCAMTAVGNTIAESKKCYLLAMFLPGNRSIHFPSEHLASRWQGQHQSEPTSLESRDPLRKNRFDPGIGHKVHKSRHQRSQPFQRCQSKGNWSVQPSANSHSL